MADPVGMGLSKRQLEYEVRWRMHQAPSDPAKMPEFMNSLIVDLIDKNNAAIADAIAERDRTDLPEEG